MHPKLHILLTWEIDSIDYYFEKGLANFINVYNNADDEIKLPKLSDKDLAISAFRYFRQSILYELNAMVEHYLQIASAGDESIFLSNKLLKRSRSESVKIIFEKYNINIENLTGYPGIKALYSMVNALKHRGGFELTDFFGEIPRNTSVDSDIETLKEIKEASFLFVKSLVNSILSMERK